MSGDTTTATKSSSPMPSATAAKVDGAELRQREINTAAAILSLSGPCRGVGDLYLTCVATAGLGMCRSYRADFEQCSKSTAESSTQMLEQIGEQIFGGQNDIRKKDRIFEAARMVNMQSLGNMQQQQQK